MIRLIKESADGTTTLKNMDTDIFPVVDFGCYWGILKDALDDVFVYDFINLDAVDPSDEYYDEVVELVDSKYDGRDEFYDQILILAPKYIQEAFDEYGIGIKVVPGSCKWYHPRQYNFGDDTIEFDAVVDNKWVNSKFAEVQKSPKFKQFVNKEFSSRDGFISFMPNDPDEYDALLSKAGMNQEFWKLVCALVKYCVWEDPSICDDITSRLYEYVISNPDYVCCSFYDIY